MTYSVLKVPLNPNQPTICAVLCMTVVHSDTTHVNSSYSWLLVEVQV